MSGPISAKESDGGRHEYRVDVLGIDEAWIDDAIVKAGGYRLTDKHTFPPGVKNCDYRIGDLFIELKILEKDVFEAEERQKKVIVFFKKEGLLDEAGEGSVDSTKLTPDQKRRLWNITLSGIQGIVKTANRQIRDTAKHLGVTEFKGLVLLVNKECESIEALSLKRYSEYVIHKEKFSSLQYVACFSAIPAVAPGSNPIIGIVVSDIKEEATADTFDRLAVAIKDKVEVILGKKLQTAPDDIGPLSNLRDDRSFTHGDTTVTFESGSNAALAQNRDKMKVRKKDGP